MSLDLLITHANTEILHDIIVSYSRWMAIGFSNKTNSKESMQIVSLFKETLNYYQVALAEVRLEALDSQP